MTEEQNQWANDDLAGQLVKYGHWLDNAASDYLRDKESVVASIDDCPRVSGRRTLRLLAFVAVTGLIVGGSFVVNQLGSQRGGPSVALAWSPQPAGVGDANDVDRKAANLACDNANPSAASLENVTTALDVRGSIGIKLWVTGLLADLCVVTLDREVPVTNVGHRIPLDMPVAASDSPETFNGIQVISDTVRSQLITVVIGLIDVLPNDCRNLDVRTDVGTVRVIRAANLFVFWYPGSPPASGMTANSIQYKCGPENGTTLTNVPFTFADDSDLASKLCVATIDVLARHGIINQAGLVIGLDNWDMEVNNEFERRLWPIAARFKASGAIYQSWSWLTGGALLALEATGAKKLQNRSETEENVEKSIYIFIQRCNHSLPAPSLAEPLPPTTTSIVPS